MNVGRIGAGWVAVLLLGPAAGAEEDVAALVRKVRARGAWIERVVSFQVEAEVRWETTPAGLAHRRKDLRKRFPGADIEKFTDLWPRRTQRVELAFDRGRMRLRDYRLGQTDDLRIWDGARFVLRDRFEGLPEKDASLIDRDPSPWLFRHALADFSSFRAGPHRFWWTKDDDHEQVVALMGRPEDFIDGGRAVFHGVECRVANHWESWTTLYIAADDGRLVGSRDGAQTTAKTQETLGRTPDAESLRRMKATMTDVIDPCWEHWLADEAAVAPGCPLPMTQTTTHYGVDDAGKPFVESLITLTITHVAVDEPLPDGLFTPTFREGETINDQTYAPSLRYPYKAHRTPEEWSQIVAEARAKARPDRTRAARQAALVGRPAPEFPPGVVPLRGELTTPAGLRGKVVLLAFWSEWSGPCRADLPALAALSRDRAREGLVVLHLHPPGSKPEAILKMADEFAITSPILVEAPSPDGSNTWGSVYGLYGVDRIPHAIVLGRDGKLAASGSLADVSDTLGALLRAP